MTTSDQASSELFGRCDSGVAVAALSPPERTNAWAGRLAGAFDQIIDRAEAGPDVRFAAASTKFTTASARCALMADYGVSWIPPRAIGLVTKVVAPDELMPRAPGCADDITVNYASAVAEGLLRESMGAPISSKALPPFSRSAHPIFHL